MLVWFGLRLWGQGQVGSHVSCSLLVLAVLSTMCQASDKKLLLLLLLLRPRLRLRVLLRQQQLRGRRLLLLLLLLLLLPCALPLLLLLLVLRRRRLLLRRRRPTISFTTATTTTAIVSGPSFVYQISFKSLLSPGLFYPKPYEVRAWISSEEFWTFSIAFLQ